MLPDADVVRRAEHALANAPSRDSLLAPWGLKFSDVKAARLGLDNGTVGAALCIPFFGPTGTLEGVKLRRLTASHDDIDRFTWANRGKAPAIYLPPGGLDSGPVFLAEGPLKAIAFEIILGRPVAALASGAAIGIPVEGRPLLHGRDVQYLADPDPEGLGCIQTLARQLQGVARELRAIPFPPPGWKYRGEAPNDVNDVLRLLRMSAGEKTLPGIAAKILRNLDRAPNLIAVAETAINAGDHDLERITETAWRALLASNNPPTLFRCGGLPSWIENDDEGSPIVRSLTQDRLRHCLARIIRWHRESKGIESPALPPIHVVRDMLAKPNAPLPVLVRIVAAPVFGADGTLQRLPGYYPGTRSYYAPPQRFTLPPVPQNPSQDDLARARTLILDDLLSDFPFVSEAERAHAVGLMIIPFSRELIDGPTPLHLLEKPAPGTGATLLTDVLTSPATGGRFSALTEGRDEDEWRKRLTSKLLGGPAIIVIDNLRGRLESAALSSAITAGTWEDRRLGLSEMVRVPVRCAWVATANNPALSAEIARRTVRIRLDAKMDRPWLRKEFQHPALRQWASEHRGELVWSACVLIRAWLAEGRPDGSASLGMFESWAAVIGGILKVAKIDGFLGNLDEFYQEADTEGKAWRAFVNLWWERFKESEVGVSQLWSIVNPVNVDTGELGDPLDLDLGEGNEKSQRTRLGKRLSEMRDRQFDKLRITPTREFRRAQMWRLVRVNV